MRTDSRPAPLLLTLLCCVPEPDDVVADDVVTDEASEGEADEASEDEASTAPEPDSECELAELALAPPPQDYEGLALVPIDILSVDATLRFDADAETAHAEARVVFRTQDRGLPFFDLRQQPTELVFDRAPLEPGQLATLRFGPQALDTMRVLEVEVSPCDLHELELSYPLQKPNSPGITPIGYQADPSAVRFEFDMADNAAGRYLEAWLPANMPWDRHALDIDVEVEAEAEHVVISNGAVFERGEGAWSVEFPSTTTALSPLLMIRPSAGLLHESGVFVTAHGQEIPWQIHVYEALDIAPAAYVEELEHLHQLVALNGRYPHDKLVVFGKAESMEYRGAALSLPSELRRELFQSWWGRGLEPATYADGWIDEAFAAYYVYPEPHLLEPDAGPFALVDNDPFVRVPPLFAESWGPYVFAHLAALMGHDALIVAMRQLSSEGLPRSLGTAELERHLYCASGEMPEVRQAFHRFVYGRMGSPEPAAAGICE